LICLEKVVILFLTQNLTLNSLSDRKFEIKVGSYPVIPTPKWSFKMSYSM